MRHLAIAVGCAVAVLACDRQAALEQTSPQLQNVRVENSSFRPHETAETPPTWVVGLRATLAEMNQEGMAIAVAERPTSDRMAWLVYDPSLSPPNWIVSSKGNPPADVGTLRTHLALLRGKRTGPIVVGFENGGGLIDELSGKVISSRVRFITRDGEGIPVLLPNLGPSRELEVAVLPRVGRVRFKRTD
jgi:hypothetical protein